MTPEEKIEIFLQLFRGRPDVHARRVELTDLASHSLKKTAYRPVHASLSTAQARAHLQGQIVDGLPLVLGVYPLLADNTTWFLAFDFDDEHARQEATALYRAGAELRIPLYVERSRSGAGYHVWLFFGAAVTASKARRLGQVLLAAAGFSFRAFDRMFPSQDAHRGAKGLGNLIALPLQNEPRKRANTVFLDPGTGEIPDQWELLANVCRLSEEEMDERLLSPQDANYAPLAKIRTRVPSVPPQPGARKLQITLSESLILDESTCTLETRSFLRAETMLENPLWHEKAKRGLSLWNTPRYVRCEARQDGFWHLPRGLWERLRCFLMSNQIDFDLNDQTVSSPLADSSSLTPSAVGTLRKYQRNTLNQVLKGNFSVLEAPTGSGKTHMALGAIAQRGVPTLILVHSRALLDQWRKKIVQALSIPAKSVGCTLPKGCLRLGPTVAIATFQSLLKRDLTDWIEHYGHLVVDECHRVPAKTFTAVVRQFRCKYMLGLTATPKRKDQMQKLIFLYLGEKIKSASPEELDRLGVIALPSYRCQPTTFECDGSEPHHVVMERVTTDAARNSQISDDILVAVREGHTALVLTDRKQQCDLISEHLADKVGLAVLYGAVGKKDRNTTVLAINDREVQVLIATANLLGEGWDCPPLSALFVASPIGDSPRLQQLIGRVTRIAPGKPKPVVYDYRDSRCAMLEGMFQKRLRLVRSHLKDERLPEDLRLERSAPKRRATISPKPVTKKARPESEGQLFLF